ncbi:hypothetical protein C9J48_12170 [Photobacterium profundum]|uniref:Elongation factor-1 alpha n=1 Tax=Photobacterium profundum 3TCK TaxID=314280 RepID=Q1Z5Y4_9GAMM|nr:hypothetical protein [Photobacterium profundum]EAS44060.1 hypothetical protein P3TCK_12766 [Photobacterium profundum 3TCK]PSV61754.1 hypothetical protein C9J48_12170 [Photobacterium profundum]
MRLHNLHFSSKLALSGFLITMLFGCLSAATLIGLVYSSNETGFNLPSIEKMSAKYNEAQLVGSMKTSMYEYVADDGDILIVEDWIKKGAMDDEQFQQEVMTIIKQDCQSCHSRTSTKSKAINSIPFSHYDDVSRFTQAGYSWQSMAKTAHIHLFGISLLLIATGLTFSCSNYNPYMKISLISISWIALWLDIASWWLAKYSTVFVYITVGAGTIEVASIVTMSALALFNIWWKIPDICK